MRNLHILLVCCSVWWAGAARRRDCGTKLDMSSNSLSLSQAMGNIHSCSLSPWTWRVSTVSTRIPSTLWEAECSSRICWFPHSRSLEGQTGTEESTETEEQMETGGLDMGLIVVPIYQEVLVLKRKQGNRCFTTAFHRLAVGCTCVRAQTTTTGSSSSIGRPFVH